MHFAHVQGASNLDRLGKKAEENFHWITAFETVKKYLHEIFRRDGEKHRNEKECSERNREQ